MPEKIKTIITKEWGEVFKQRLVLFTVLFLPLLFTVIAFSVLLTNKRTVTIMNHLYMFNTTSLLKVNI